MATIRAIAYVRVSTDEQAQEGYSLAAQEQRIRQYAELYGIDVVLWCREPGVSAKDLNRYALTQAFARLASGAADGLIIAKLDRLTRSVGDWERLIARYFGEEAGKQLWSVGEQIDTRTAGGRLVLRILVTVAQWEREVIGERTRAALEAKRLAGEHIGKIPYGYRLDDAGRLEPTADEVEVIAQMAALAAQGLTDYRIAATLNAAGARTRTGRFWSPASVGRCLARAEEIFGG